MTQIERRPATPRLASLALAAMLCVVGVSLTGCNATTAQLLASAQGQPTPEPGKAPPSRPAPPSPGTPAPDSAVPNPFAGLFGGGGGQAARPGAGVPAELRPLFAKGRVNGKDMMEYLVQMRQELTRQKSVKAWARASMALDLSVNSAMSGRQVQGALMDTLKGAAVEIALNELRSRALNVGFKALDEHLSALLGNELSKSLADISVTLPDSTHFTPADSKRALNMATMVVAAKLTAKIMEEADSDFKSLEVDYKELLDQREEAAKLLFSTVDKRRAAQSSGDTTGRRAAEANIRRGLSEADLRFIDEQLATMTLAQFTKDMAAQNLALQYLRLQDPEAFKKYSTKKDDVVRRTQAYMRTVSGVIAFAGLSTSFVQSVSELGRKNNAPNLISSMPLIVDFATAAVPLLPTVAKVVGKGLTFPFQQGTPHLFVVAHGDQVKELKDAKAVFAELKTAGADERFSKALFRERQAGWLNGVRSCDAAEAGRMLDAAIPGSERAKFAEAYFGEAGKEQGTDYSFVNSFTAPSMGQREMRLAEDLLGRDHRERHTGVGGEFLAEVQRNVSDRYGEWNNQQLLRMIFANRESSSPSHAMLEMGGGRFAVRPVPSPEAIFVYESHVSSCAVRTASAQGAAPAPAATPRPQATPRPAPSPRPQGTPSR
ncbi:MAG: hypothetical protein JNJ71_19445 [Rubrivivax sp.]|nr:hypothetical protein [Rubrivivax sp.]